MKPTDLIFLLTGIVAAIIAIVAFISAKPVIAEMKLLGKIFFIGCILLLAITPPVQFYVQKNYDEEKSSLKLASDFKKDSIKRVQEDKRDAAIRYTYDTSNKSTVISIVKQIGKYGFKYDSISKIVDRINVAANLDPTLQMSPRPVNGFSYSGIENDNYKYFFEIKSADAPSSEFKIKYSICVSDSNNRCMYVLGGDELLPENSKIQKEGSELLTFQIPLKFNFNMAYLWIRGTYKNSNGTKAYTINDV